MPGYGSLTAGAARGFYRASRNPNNVYLQYQEGSLLAQNFNRLWCTGLNQRHRGEPLDYWAMQHADIEPEDFWLDKLIDELEDHQLDVLGVVAPIKDTRGRTSIALARPDGDNWRAHCRLTLDEVYRLPETFTSAAVGYPLLINTGLWVCRFDLDWAKLVHFEINDRIAFDPERDEYHPQVEPEDWYFSRVCHQLGLKIGVTRKVRLAHRGDVQFANTEPWGDAYDAEYVPASVLPTPAICEVQ